MKPKNNPRVDELITSSQAAKLLGFTPDHVRRMINQGKIQAVKMGHIWMLKTTALKGIERQRSRKES